MNPKEKAKQLYSKFYGIPLYIKTVKECCYIAIDEMIEQLDSAGLYTSYWNEVKKEVENI